MLRFVFALEALFCVVKVVRALSRFVYVALKPIFLCFKRSTSVVTFRLFLP